MTVLEFPVYLQNMLDSNNPSESSLQELVDLDNTLLETLEENRKKMSKQLEQEQIQRDLDEENAKIAAAEAAEAETAQKEIKIKQDQVIAQQQKEQQQQQQSQQQPQSVPTPSLGNFIAHILQSRIKIDKIQMFKFAAILTSRHKFNIAQKVWPDEILKRAGSSEGLKIRRCQYILVDIICPPWLK